MHNIIEQSHIFNYTTNWTCIIVFTFAILFPKSSYCFHKKSSWWPATTIVSICVCSQQQQSSVFITQQQQQHHCHIVNMHLIRYFFGKNNFCWKIKLKIYFFTECNIRRATNTASSIRLCVTAGYHRLSRSPQHQRSTCTQNSRKLL